MKKPGAYRIFLLIILVFLIIYFIYELVFAENPDIRHTSKALMLIVVYGAAIMKTQMGSGPSVSQKRVYEDTYKNIIENAFAGNASARKKLLKAIHLYNQNKNQKAVSVLEQLSEKCETKYDITAVHMFKGYCHTEICEYNSALSCYDEVLKTDGANAEAWSNLGAVYEKLGKTARAAEAYLNAVRYDPENLLAYNNLASLSVQAGQADEALKYALKELEINSGMVQAAGFAAAAYAMKNDRENSEKYFRQYRNGGGNDPDVLEKWISDLLNNT